MTQRILLLVFGATVVNVCASPLLYAQPPRRHIRPPWHIEPTEETIRKVEALVREVRDAEISINVQPNRSRLIRTNYPILRFSITNPSILDIIQYSPTEFELVGLRPGITTMTIWYRTDEGIVRAARMVVPMSRSGTTR